MLKYVCFAMMLLVVSGPTRAADPDIVIADFEGSDYGSWQVTGKAFGRQGSRQQLLRRGRHHRDPDVHAVQDRTQVHQFPDRRRHASGQGLHQSCDRRDGRSHRYRAERPSGRLGSAGLGRLGCLRSSGPDGTDTDCRSSHRIDGKIVREFSIELASGEADYWVFLDVSPFAGKKGTLRIDRYDPLRASGFDVVFQADTFPGQKDVYRERLRPQVHFTSRRGWNNDTNGMMYYDGEYHLFYQHNPYGWNWGNMTWGHAVSEDMVHWKELDDAIHPDHLGTILSTAAIAIPRSSGTKRQISG